MAGVHRGHLRGEPGGILGVLTVLTDRWGALTADFRRLYGLSLADAVTTLPFHELADLIDHLPPQGTAIARDVLGPLADWSPTDENIAMLVDADRNDLQFRWSQWTATDADRRRAKRGRSPKTPPLTPYAVRPTAVTEALAAAADAVQPRAAAPTGSRDGMRAMSIEDLARLI